MNMKNFIFFLKKVCTWRFYLSAVGTLLIMLFSFYPYTFHIYSENISMRTALFSMYDKGPLYVLSVLLASIPGVTAWLDDRVYSSAKYMIARLGKNKYGKYRFFSNILLGSGSILIGEMLALIYCVYFFPSTDINLGFLEMTPPFEYLYEYNPIAYFLIYFLLGFVANSAWISIGLSISTFIYNRYIVSIFPFILYIFLLYISDFRLFGAAYSMGNAGYPILLKCTCLYLLFIFLSYMIFKKGVNNYDAS